MDHNSGTALTLVAQSFMGRASFNFFVFAGGLLAIVTTLNASLMWEPVLCWE